MKDVPSNPMGDFENTLVGTVFQTVRSRNEHDTGPCSHGALLMAFATAQSDQLKTYEVYLPSRFWRCFYSQQTDLLIDVKDL